MLGDDLNAFKYSAAKCGAAAARHLVQGHLNAFKCRTGEGPA